MNIRSAILAAADHIEANPGEFDFRSVDQPGCGSPGCALGWIGFFAKQDPQAGECYVRTVANSIGLPSPEDSMIFYNRMNALPRSTGWTRYAALCASTLRAYANAYHPASPSLDPAYVSWRDALKRENGYGVVV